MAERQPSHFQRLPGQKDTLFDETLNSEIEYRASSSRTSGREQKKVACVKGMTGEGEGEGKEGLPLPFHLFVFRFRSNFRAITRLETLATQATSKTIPDSSPKPFSDHNGARTLPLWWHIPI